MTGKISALWVMLHLLRCTQSFCKFISEKWKSLPQDTRQEYLANSAEAMKQYLDSLSEEDKDIIHDLRVERKTQKTERRKRKEINAAKTKLKEMGKPTRPLAPFFQFLNTLDKGDGPSTTFIAGAAQRYRQLPVDDKEVFSQRFAKNMETYEQEYNSWVERMIREGNGFLLPKVDVAAFFKNPKRPRGAKYLYIDEKIPGKVKETSDSEVQTITKALATAYEALSKKDKEKYVAQSKADMAMYMADKKKFLEKMKTEGLYEMFAVRRI